MLQMDHLILRVADPAASVRFYRQILALEHERAPPFEVLRINDDCVIDLLAEAPKDTMHLAFSLGRQAFDTVRERLQASGVAFGSSAFVRDGRVARQYGARGWGDALYFHDLDHHNIEARTYDKS
ncbi:hypothetical protein LYSHEL_07130 [Lysobacter helvus]|uniref:VOC domain-containing protein n=2 Tax=Lysobacteraceae TaxID=32033 RepID=A0ABM7Q346_9GAMM|nr:MULTISPECIES: VOC family protein [Lysobacter]BCT91689.1 hypothetical protein LYSCAS_07130 [Lysobacter caseinilyticus]BCT94842.1 hypothetical protein LYSHEL_07130 [Lysobacter helvus]